MMKQFYDDLAHAKYAEQLVRDVFAARTSDYTFELVADDPIFYHRGDIKATAANGKEIMIEVKDDSRIFETGNVLCEDEVYFKDCDYWKQGNMKSEYQIYVVVSQQERKMYIIDFSKLVANYKKGEYKVIEHKSSTTFCYLCSLLQINQWGAMIDVIEY